MIKPIILMKRLALLTAFIGLFCNPLWSQESLILKLDSTSNKPLLERKIGNLNMVTNKKTCGLPNRSINGVNINKNLRFGTVTANSTGNGNKYDNMPVLIPKGNFYMHVVKPDSTIEYTMLVIKP